MELWINIAAAIGVVTLFVIILGAVCLAHQGICELVKMLRYEYRYKHRFDKSPTAKCYCKDCRYWGYQGRCGKFKEWYTADCWFCWNAEPRDKEVEGNE